MRLKVRNRAKNPVATIFRQNRSFVRESVYVHDLNKLLAAAGLESTLNTAVTSNAALKTSWALAKDWKPESRYLLGGLNGRDAVSRREMEFLDGYDNIGRCLISVGRSSLHSHKRIFRSASTLWAYVPQIDEWQFLIATPLVDSRGPKAAYERVLQALYTMQEWIRSFRRGGFFSAVRKIRS